MNETHVPALPVSIEFHTQRVDGGVNHNPGPSPQLSMRWDVHKHWLVETMQGINDIGTKLQYLVIHI